MNRRSFLATTVALAARTAAQTPGPRPRRVYPLNRKWLFNGKPVTLPHTNIELPWHSFEDRSYQFVSHYQRRFRAPASAS